MDPVQTHLYFDFSAILIFFLVAIAFVVVTLLIGAFLRPKVHHPDKSRIYECGEPTIGSAWIRYNIRVYSIALVFLIFDVEVAFLFPVIVVLKDIGWTAFFEVVFFMAVLALGLVYAWRFGSLDWIRAGEIAEEEDDAGESSGVTQTEVEQTG